MVRYFNWDISFSHFPWPIIFHIFDRGEQSSLNQNSMSWRTTHWTMRTLPPTVLCRSEQQMLEAKRMTYTFYFFWINSRNFSGEFSKFIKIRALLNTLNIPFSFLNMSTHSTFKCFKNTASLKGMALGFPCLYWPIVSLCVQAISSAIGPTNYFSYRLTSWLLYRQISYCTGHMLTLRPPQTRMVWMETSAV